MLRWMLALALLAAPSARAQAPLTAAERKHYRQVAEAVIERIAALEDRYPHLADFRRAGWRENAPDHFWLAYHYARGTGWKPNPQHRRGTKGDARIKTFSEKDGCSLDLYFFEGAWPGQATVRPTRLGKIQLVMFLEGADTPEFAALRKDVGRVLDEAAKQQVK